MGNLEIKCVDLKKDPKNKKPTTAKLATVEKW